MEPTKKARAVRSLLKQLWEIGSKADDLGLLLANGSDVGALLGSIAAELETAIEDGAFDS